MRLFSFETSELILFNTKVIWIRLLRKEDRSGGTVD